MWDDQRVMMNTDGSWYWWLWIPLWMIHINGFGWFLTANGWWLLININAWLMVGLVDKPAAAGAAALLLPWAASSAPYFAHVACLFRMVGLGLRNLCAPRVSRKKAAGLRTECQWCLQIALLHVAFTLRRVVFGSNMFVSKKTSWMYVLFTGLVYKGSVQKTHVHAEFLGSCFYIAK